MLELIAKGVHLPVVLDSLCKMVEGQSEEGMVASILLADPDGRHLRLGAAQFARGPYPALDVLAIGPAAGSSGTAAFRREPVYVEDITTDPLCADLAGVAVEAGLHACLWHPSSRTRGSVLGTFTRTSHPAPRMPFPRPAAGRPDHSHGGDCDRAEAVRARALGPVRATAALVGGGGGALDHGRAASHAPARFFGKIRSHLGVDTYLNYMVANGGSGSFESYFGIPTEAAQSMLELENGEGICGSVARSLRPIVLSHVQQSDNPRAEVEKSLGIRAYVCSPLVADLTLLGTLSFASHTRDRFNDDELEFLRTLAHYVTVAYERLRRCASCETTTARRPTSSRSCA